MARKQAAMDINQLMDAVSVPKAMRARLHAWLGEQDIDVSALTAMPESDIASTGLSFGEKAYLRKLVVAASAAAENATKLHSHQRQTMHAIIKRDGLFAKYPHKDANNNLHPDNNIQVGKCARAYYQGEGAAPGTGRRGRQGRTSAGPCGNTSR